MCSCTGGGFEIGSYVVVHVGGKACAVGMTPRKPTTPETAKMETRSKARIDLLFVLIEIRFIEFRFVEFRFIFGALRGRVAIYACATMSDIRYISDST